MKIRFTNGKNKDRELELTSSSVTIGRDSGNLIIFDTDGVSRCHAEIKQQPSGEWYIYDLNSTNGVKVNGVKISSRELITAGNEITIGENSFCIEELKNEPARVIFNPIVSAPPVSPQVISSPSGASDNPPENGSAKSEFPGTEAEKIRLFAAAGATPAPRTDSAEPSSEAAHASETLNAEKIAAEFHKISGSIFSKKGKEKISDENNGSEKENDSKKRRSNMIFYTVLVCVVIMILSSAFSIMSPKKQTRKHNSNTGDLAVRYEKEVLQRDNIFRFEFFLKSKFETASANTEDAAAPKGQSARKTKVYTAVFTIDDVNSKRHYSKETPISSETVDQLRSAIRGSGIYTVDNSETPRDDFQNRTLTIAEGARLITVKVAGEYASQEFNTVEEAIIAVAESFGLKTIAMTPEQLLSQAEDYFLKAEDLFSNRAKTSNLRDAIIRYRAVVESLEQFSPKPKMWDRARKQLEKAQKERDAKLEMLDTEYKRLAQMREFAPMREIFLNIMDLTEPESKEYAKAKRRLVIIDQALRKKKRK